MSEAFNPYHSWLGIPLTDQPADYYRLLGVSRFEASSSVISNAADRQMRHVRTFQLGENAVHSQTLLNELATARVCLLNSASKAAYDRQLRAQVAKQIQSPIASPPPAMTLSARRSKRVRSKNPQVEVAKIVAGGIAGLVIGAFLLWYVFDMDVLGVTESASERQPAVTGLSVAATNHQQKADPTLRPTTPAANSVLPSGPLVRSSPPEPTPSDSDSDSETRSRAALSPARFIMEDYKTGKNVTSVATVDLNGDGFLDLISSNTDDHNVSVRLGKGDGTFATRKDFPANRGAYGLATGDVDDDGHIDLAVGSLTSNVSILRGNGDGAFGSPLEYVGSPEHRGVALKDLNNDRFLDLIYTNNATVSVRFGNGEGDFGEPNNYSVGDSPYWLTVADVNEDGAFDVVTANFNSRSVSVLLNNGTGDLRPRTDFPIGSKVRSVELGDLNGNGHFDLVTANHAGNNVSVLLGNGTGTFNKRVDYPVGAVATSVSLADLNNDGNLDVVVSVFSDRSISVLSGQGDGTFANCTSHFITSSPHHGICSDLDGDGNIDIVTANSDDNTISVWLSREGIFGGVE